MYLLVLLLPLLNIIFSCLLGRFLGLRVFNLFIINFSINLLICLFIFFEVGILSTPTYIEIGNWFSIGVLNLNWTFVFDSITAVMIVLVVFVSFLVHLYSIEYMSDDPHIIRFLGYLSIFTFFMLMLVTAGNFVQMFLGWEGVGLSSYLLINFWYTRLQANKSAMKAIFINRFGDFGIYFSILAIFYFFKSLDFSTVFLLIHYFSFNFHIFNYLINPVDLVCFFLFFGAIGKSAQISLHTWLPDAMEGPTPVSALIHAATMVTAGVFVVIRCSPLFEYSSIALFLIVLFGSVTSLLAGLLGLVQNDIKKVIAYSTCSQLGYMFVACGMSDYSIGLFHLFNHGFFKALLFLGAGSIIHALLDEQDIRKMGGLIKLLPLTYCIIVVGSLCLIGFPFLSGFYSKELILETAFVKISFGLFFYYIGVFAAFITAFYSTRLLYFVFLSKPNANFRVLWGAHESTGYIFYTISVLGFVSIFIGFIVKDIFSGFGVLFFSNSIFQLLNHFTLLEMEFLNFYFKLIPLLLSVLGVVCAVFVFDFFYLIFLYIFFKYFKYLSFVYLILIKKWFFDLFYNNGFVYTGLFLCYHITFKLIDRGFIEVFGPLGIVRLLGRLSKLSTLLQAGYLYHYIFIGVLAVTFIVFCGGEYWFFWNNIELIGLFFIFCGFYFI